MTNECPACGCVHDAVTSTNGEYGPRPGDVSICSQCGAINVFDEKLVLRLVPDAECATKEMVHARELRDRIRRMRGLPVKEAT